MNVLKRIIFILIIFTCVFIVMPKNVSNASLQQSVESFNPEPPGEGVDFSKIKITLGKFLGFLQVTSAFLTIIVLAFTGFDYIVGTPEVKKDILNKMFPLVLGLVILFSAVSIAKFFLTSFDKNSEGTIQEPEIVASQFPQNPAEGQEFYSSSEGIRWKYSNGEWKPVFSR